MAASIHRLVPTEGVQEHALSQLTAIRRTMAQATAFTALSGIGTLGLGGLALMTSYWTWGMEGRDWLLGWGVCACVGFALGVGSTFVKSHRVGQGLFGPAGSRFLRGLLPALVAGSVLTFSVALREQWTLLPGIWLLLYGLGVVAAGAHSALIVPMMGYSFMLLAIPALLCPPELGTLWMAMGFGVLHVGFGAGIARRYGG